jgi:hypothetical protein
MVRFSRFRFIRHHHGARIRLASVAYFFALTACGGGTSFAPPPIDLSVSVNNTTVVVPANSTAVNIPATIVAPTETATFTITVCLRVCRKITRNRNRIRQGY